MSQSSVSRTREPGAVAPAGRRRPRRWGWLVAVLPAVLAVALVVAGLITRSARTAEFDDIVTVYDVSDGVPVSGAVAYDEAPPVGGDFAALWQRCGVYGDPVPNGRAVHSLRRGAVWITFQPGASEDDIALLAAFTASPLILVSPYPGQTSPVVVTAWGRQLAVRSPDDWQLSEFVRAFQGGAQAPEGAAGCAGGATRTAS